MRRVALARPEPAGSLRGHRVTASAGRREIAALLEAGATACLRKDQELEEIVDAIKRAAESATWT